MTAAIFNFLRLLRKVTNGIGYITLVFMMLFLTYTSISRTIGKPVLGDIELTSLAMVVLIMMGLVYAESIGSHIRIEILVDRFPRKVQFFLEAVSAVLTLCVSLLIAYVYYYVGITYFVQPMSTEILKIALMPFKFLITLSFFLWGLEAFMNLIDDLRKLFGKEAAAAASAERKDVTMYAE